MRALLVISVVAIALAPASVSVGQVSITPNPECRAALTLRVAMSPSEYLGVCPDVE